MHMKQLVKHTFYTLATRLPISIISFYTLFQIKELVTNLTFSNPDFTQFLKKTISNAMHYAKNRETA